MGDDLAQVAFHWADYLVLGLVLSISVIIGIFYAIRGRKRRTTDEFMAAHKQMGFFPVAMSLLASLFTGIYIQGMVSEVYFRGAMPTFLGTIPLAITAYIAGTIFLPKFYKLELRSVYQYLEMRFNGTIRNCCLIVGYIYMILHAGVATFAACLVLTTVSNMSFSTSLLMLTGICTFYTAVGGIKAVLWADCFQMFLIFSPVVCAVIIGCISPGIGVVWEISKEGGRLDFKKLRFDPTQYLDVWSTVIGGAFAWMPAQCVLQYQVQRYNTCKDERTAHMAMGLFSTGALALVMLCGLAGLCIYAIFVDCDPSTAGFINFNDELLPYFILQAFHHLPGVPGLAVSGLCSACLSTVSSIMNSIVTISCEHTVKKIWKNMPDSRLMLISKFLVLFFGALNVGVTYLMSSLGDIVPTLIGLIGITSGPVTGVFILGLMFPRCNSKGALIGFITGTLFGLWIFIGSAIYMKPPTNLPLSVDRCPNQLVTSDMYSTDLPGTNYTAEFEMTEHVLTEITPGFEFITDIAEEGKNVFVLYLITRWWYPTITTCTVIIIGMLASLITGFNDPARIEKKLLVDWLSACCWCRQNTDGNFMSVVDEYSSESEVYKTEKLINSGESLAFTSGEEVKIITTV